MIIPAFWVGVIYLTFVLVALCVLGLLAFDWVDRNKGRI